MRKKITVTFLFVFISYAVHAQKNKNFALSSPDGNIQLKIDAGEKLQWSVMYQSAIVIAPSSISLQMQGGETLGDNAKISSSKNERINNRIAALHYKKDTVEDNYNQLTLNFKGDYGVIFRAYNDGVAYRFFTKKKDSIVIQSEEANFNFTDDDSAFIPYSNDPHNGDKYECSFENTYQHIKLSQFIKDTVAFAPVLVELANNKKVVITEANLEDYPGMFLTNGKIITGLSGDFAPYVLEDKQGGHNNLQAYVTKRADYIARTNGTRSFPWRVVVISTSDKDLLNNDMVYRLASPSRVEDVSWIKPGKVAWDWWSDWNISHIDFKAGINTQTYKYYIDFAAANHIEYIKQKNVGVWLWGGWLPLDKKIDEALGKYSKMGIKGFKIDFMDRDDQK